MKKMVFCLWVVVLIAWSSLAGAAVTFDVAARAKAIAPFIDEETVAILHVDLSHVDVNALGDQIASLAPETQATSAKTKREVAEKLREFTDAGGRDFYTVVSLAGRFPDPALMPMVVPLYPGTDVDALKRMAELKPGRRFRSAGEVIRGCFVIGNSETIERLKAIKPDVRPELEKAFEAAGDTAAQLLLLPPKHTARTLNEMMPELPKQLGGGPVTVLTKGCLWAAIGVDLPPKMVVRATIQSADADAAKALLAKWESATVFVKNAMNAENETPLHVADFDKLCETLKPHVEGDRLVLVLDEQNQGVARVVALLTPPIEAARKASTRMQSMNHLKMIGIAMHNWHDVHKTFPAAASYDKDGKPLLSWRVRILPYIEENKLYQEFHLDEPWDSPNNKKLIDRMPACLRSPASKLADKGRTNYVVVVGDGTVFGGKKGTSIREIRDGTSMTILVVEADDTHAPIWTKPEDLPLDPKEPKRGLGGLWDGKFFLAAFCDGSVHVLATSIDPQILRCLFLKDDRTPIPYEKLQEGGARR